jgi:hypothetical protein
MPRTEVIAARTADSKTFLLGIEDRVAAVTDKAASLGIELTKADVEAVAKAEVAFVELRAVSSAKATAVAAAVGTGAKSEVAEKYDYNPPTHAVEVGCHHVEVDGAWVDVETALVEVGEQKDDLFDFVYTHEARNHPLVIRFSALSQEYRVGDVLMSPQKTNEKAELKVMPNGFAYKDAWEGINLWREVTKRGLREILLVRQMNAQPFVRWDVQGKLADLVAPHWFNRGVVGEVDYTFENGVLAYSLGNLIAGTVVV